jgi:hypothetical protein
MTQSKKARRWKMWARVRRVDGEAWTPDFSFYRDMFTGKIAPHEQLIRVEVRELVKRRKRK